MNQAVVIPLALAALWLAAINTAALIAFGYDKAQARQGGWRISEATLLGLAMLGGSPGAIAAQRHFRHKTRRGPFRSTLFAITALQAALLTALAIDPYLLASALAAYA